MTTRVDIKPEERTDCVATIPTLVVFSDDWGRHPSSCQHLVSRLLDRFDVYWVNTIGTRPPRVDLYTLQRGVSKLRHWISSPPTENCEAKPTVLNPTMWPGFGSAPSRWLNRKLLSRCLHRYVPSENGYVLTTIPIVADLVGQIPARRWIYYCVDDLSEWPGLDRRTLLKMEAQLLAQVDSVVAVSPHLRDRLTANGHRPHLLTHGVNLEDWAPADAQRSLPDFRNIPEPRIVFWGLVDRRLNVEWIEALSRSLDTGSIVLVGPENNPDPKLSQLRNLHRVPAVDYEQLGSVAQSADVLIMPYSDLPVTRAMQPLKFKEYLATFKPTVSSALPAVSQWTDAADVVTCAEDFVAAVHRRLQTGLPPDQHQARSRLNQESWDHKAETLAEIIANHE